MVPAIGARRRLQALAALGYSYVEVGELLGTAGSNVAFLANRKRMIRPETDSKVLIVYDKLSMVIPPDCRRKSYALTFARKNGYLPPLAWDDETMDDPYALPSGLPTDQMTRWFWKAASMQERIEWVLEYGKPPYVKALSML